MICPIHKCEVTPLDGMRHYKCPECCRWWPAGLLEQHQPPTRAERRAKRMATLADNRRPGEDALVEYLRGQALPATVADVARGGYYRWRNPRTRDLPCWPEGRHGARDWLRRLEAQGRVEKTAEGWRAKA